MNKLMLSLSTLLATSATYAFFCPTNFQQINMGDTMDKVTATCGKPTNVTETKSDVVNDNVPQEWTYYVSANSGFVGNMQNPASIKMTATFDASGKVVNISVNGMGMGSTGICGNSFQIGSTREQVQAACGKAAFINRQAPDPTTAATAPKQNVTTIYEYKTNIPVKLIFTNGVLTGKQ